MIILPDTPLVNKWRDILLVEGDRIPELVDDPFIIFDMVEMFEIISLNPEIEKFAPELVPFVRREFPYMDGIERCEVIRRYKECG